jgi:ubiquinone/menaquinone biosynthesis C-methylase UbiE
MTMPPRFIAKQLSHPTGLFGSIMARLMNRHNAKMNAFAMEQLDLKPTDRVLEIGFGGGLNLSHLISNVAFVAGVDRSSAMVKRAKKYFRDAVSSGRADFREGSVEAIPFESESFDKVCTVNTIYFWNSLEAGFAEIYRILSPTGRAVIGFLPKDHMDHMGMPSDIFTTRGPQEVVSALELASFSEIRIERPNSSTSWNVLIASR